MGEAASEAALREWAASHQLTGKTVDLLVKDGFSSMQAVALLESVDLAQSKIPRGQQKLLLKSVVELRPPVAAGPDRDGETTAIASTATGAHVVVGTSASGNQREAAILAAEAGDAGPARGAAASGAAASGAAASGAAASGAAAAASGTTAQAQSGWPVSQHPVNDIFAGMAVDHMRSMQATCGARHHATTDTNDGVPANVNVTAPPFYAGATGASSLFGGQPQRQPQPPAVGNTTSWQDPRIYLAAAAVGKSTCHHDIADFVAKDSVCEDVVAGTHDGTHIVVKSGSKPKLDNITLSQWSIANLAILYVLLGEGKLLPDDILDYLSYSTKVYELTQRYENTSVYLYDREYRKLQACHGFRWGTDIPHLQTIRLIPRVSHSDRRPRPQHPPYGQSKQVVAGTMTGDGRAICRLYNTQRGCGYTDCKFVHACSYRGCFQVHPATVHLPPQ